MAFDVNEILDGTHAGNLLASPGIDISLDANPQIFDDFFGEMLGNAETPKAFCQTLFDAKAQVAAVYAKSLIGSAEKDQETNEKLGRYWSAFADWSINKTLDFVWSQPAIKRFLVKDTEPGLGLFLLGLGKLGGQDLNYSSDVDLICFFDSDIFSVNASGGKTDVAIRALKLLTQILGGTHGPRIWRVDWRLRPDPSLTGLAMPSASALDYFFFHAAPWRRLAMMKARVVAGDLSVGKAWLAELTPFVWRKTLDFRAMEEISGIKKRIRDEHPDLGGGGVEDTPLDRAEGFHVKLGSGGIREIEFIANALQLVWGGRQIALRRKHTVTVLGELAAADLLEIEQAERLISSYRFLRGLENRIQLLGDEHVHTTPEEEWEDLIALYDDTSPEVLFEDIIATRVFVNEVFEGVFEDDTEESTNQGCPESLKGELTEQNQSVIERWSDGFGDHGVPPEIRPKLAPLFTAICKLLERSIDKDETVTSLQGFFSLLPPGGQYLRLLAENSGLLEDILRPLVGGGAMANLLRHSPHVVDLLIEQRGDAELSAEERAGMLSVVSKLRRYEDRLEALRSYVNEVLYLAYLRVWRGELGAANGRALLTRIALEALEAAMTMVREELGTDAQLSVVGYGKLGMEALMPESDLDLVFFAHGENEISLEDVEPAHRFSNRLKTALTSEMRGGIVYEIDMRLRPSGASGAPTVRLATFEGHQMNHAKTWEHLALVPAAFAVGPDFARQAFDQVRCAVLTRPRNQTQLVQDAHSMLQQLRDHRITKPKKGTLALKLSPGGLMEAEYLTAYLVLKWAADHPQLAKMKYVELTGELERIDDELSGLKDALSFLQDAHFQERLLGWHGKKIDGLNLSRAGYEQVAFAEALKKHTGLVSKLIEREVVKASGLSAAQLSSYSDEAVGW